LEQGLSSLNSFEIFLAICAGIGGVLLLIRLVLMFVGADTDVDGDIDASGGGDLDGHLDSDASFKILSLQGISAFFLMFGLVGLAMYRQSGNGMGLSLIAACAAGLASVWVIGKIFSGAKRLQSSGTVKLASAVGATGTVYLTIPATGTGRVIVEFNRKQMELDAVSADAQEIPTGIVVKVKSIAGNVLTVERA